MGEVAFRGFEVIDDSNPTYACTPVLTVGTTKTSLNSTVTYLTFQTALLTSISPRFGTVKGGTAVTFTGTNFVTNTALYTITIDGINCPVTAATTTTVTCTTGKRPGLVEKTTLDF